LYARILGNLEVWLSQEGEAMPNREMIRQALVEIMEADTGEKYLDLDDSRKLREDLGLDSVDVVSIVSQIERRFRIRLSAQELETLVTVGDVLPLLENKRAALAVEPLPASDASAA